MDFEEFVSLIKNLDLDKKPENIKENRHIFGFHLDIDNQNPRPIYGPGAVFLDSNDPELALIVVATNGPINQKYEAFMGTPKMVNGQPLLTEPGGKRFLSGHLVGMLDSLADQLKPLVESLDYAPEGPRKIWPKLEALRVDTIYTLKA